MNLTPRQLDCIRALLVTGNGKEAAARLGISPYTLKGHVAGARERLGVDTTAQAVAVLALSGDLGRA